MGANGFVTRERGGEAAGRRFETALISQGEPRTRVVAVRSPIGLEEIAAYSFSKPDLSGSVSALAASSFAFHSVALAS